VVLQDGEKCGGYTFLVRKKNKINRKLTASEARHLAKPQNVICKLKPMKTIILTIFLLAIAIFLTFFSQGVTTSLFLLAVMIIVAIFGSVLLSIWFEGNFKSKFYKACKLVFPLTITIFLLGYFYKTFIVML
jgi:hypothetical protein